MASDAGTFADGAGLLVRGLLSELESELVARVLARLPTPCPQEEFRRVWREEVNAIFDRAADRFANLERSLPYV